ncbi:MAG: bifunctional oligoribonuclease/PAP phosphatase NrnA [Deltaproteobacteria bacterium]|jgi:bifunctional oligoribonuclease and PAP phosphatase NrnA|nr:bifunctional oligoribonuclease/PAP phosphatase NrnA [Deltaproteobacteria bacterium]
MSKSVNYDSFVDRVKESKSFIIGSHYNPDGDGIGSTLALGIALGRMGKSVVMYNRDGVPFNLKFLKNYEQFVTDIDVNVSYDMMIMVDCAQKNRVSDDFANLKNIGNTICIDHHDLEGVEADLLLIDKNAASTGEVVLHLLEHAGVEICSEIAQAIYTTLVVDTGFFKYSNTSSDVLKIAGQLVEAGASPWTVARELDESKPFAAMRLLSYALESMEVSMNGQYCTMDLTLDMLKRSGALMEHSEEFATYPRSVLGVEVAALFREVEDGAVKISLRSKDVVDVAKIAKSFGGGGHAHAAGFRVRLSLQEAKDKVASAISDSLTV